MREARGGGSFRDLRVWQEAKGLAVDVYRVTAGFPEGERDRLGDQMRRAAVSVHANVAEGSGRASRSDFARFLAIAWGSLRELDAHAEVAHAAGLLPHADHHALSTRIRQVGQLLAGLRRHLR